MRRRRFAYEHSQPVLHPRRIPWSRILILGTGAVVALAVLRHDRGNSLGYGKSTAFTQMSSVESDQSTDGLALLTTAGIAGGAYVVYKLLSLPAADPAPSPRATGVLENTAPRPAPLTLPDIPALHDTFDWGSINWESVKRALDESLKSKAAPKQTWNPPLWLDILP